MPGQNVVAKRRWGRAPTQLSARIFAMTSFMKFGPDVDCTVINISEGGALLQTAEEVAIPEDFYLVIDSLPDRKIVCSVVHRRGQRFGVSFSVQLPRTLIQSLGKRSRISSPLRA